VSNESLPSNERLFRLSDVMSQFVDGSPVENSRMWNSLLLLQPSRPQHSDMLHVRVGVLSVVGSETPLCETETEADMH
jgi:hypothetical protein